MKQVDPFTNTAFKFGFGFFETMRAIKEKIIFFDEHIDRLNSSLKHFNLQQVEKEEIRKNILNEIKEKNLEDARIRITYSLQNNEPFLTYEVLPFEKIFPDKANIMLYENFIPHEDLLRQHKTTNYFLYFYQYKRAISFGFDEIIFFDDAEHIVEGSRTNIFLVFYKENFDNLKIYTPDISCGVLPGIARKKVIELCKSLGFQIKETQIPYEAIFKAKEIFLTNSLNGVIPTTGTKRKVKNEITIQIKNEFDKFYQV